MNCHHCGHPSSHPVAWATPDARACHRCGKLFDPGWVDTVTAADLPILRQMRLEARTIGRQEVLSGLIRLLEGQES